MIAGFILPFSALINCGTYLLIKVLLLPIISSSHIVSLHSITHAALVFLDINLLYQVQLLALFTAMWDCGWCGVWSCHLMLPKTFRGFTGEPDVTIWREFAPPHPLKSPPVCGQPVELLLLNDRHMIIFHMVAVN